MSSNIYLLCVAGWQAMANLFGQPALQLSPELDRRPALVCALAAAAMFKQHFPRGGSNCHDYAYIDTGFPGDTCGAWLVGGGSEKNTTVYPQLKN